VGRLARFWPGPEATLSPFPSFKLVQVSLPECGSSRRAAQVSAHFVLQRLLVALQQVKWQQHLHHRVLSTYRVVNCFRPLSASWAIRDMLLLDRSMRRSRRKLENDFGGSSVMKFCSRRLQKKNQSISDAKSERSTAIHIQRCTTYSSVVSSGKVTGTLVRLFSRQSTIPSAQRHGCGQLFSAPHSIGACSVRPDGQTIWLQRLG